MNIWHGRIVQDKWRNLSVTAGGYGSREKARMALKKGKRVVPKLTAGPMEIDANDVDNIHDSVVDAEPLAMALEPLPLEESPDKSVARLVGLIQMFYKKLLLNSLYNLITTFFTSQAFLLANSFYVHVGPDRN